MNKSSSSSIKQILVLIGICVLMGGCGYKFAGSGGPPQGMSSIFVSLIENQTAEIGAEIILTDQLKNEFIRKYNGQLVPKDQAEGVLSGRIKNIRSWTVARRGAQESLEKRVSVSIDLTLKNQGGDVIWYVRGMSGSEVYAVSQTDKVNTETNKRRAIELVCLRLGEEAYYRMTEDF